MQLNTQERSYFHVFVDPDEVGRPKDRRLRGESLALQFGNVHANLQLFPNGHLQSNALSSPELLAEATFNHDGSPLYVKIEYAQSRLVITWDAGKALVNGWSVAELGAHYPEYKKWYYDLARKVQSTFTEYLSEFGANFFLPDFP